MTDLSPVPIIPMMPVISFLKVVFSYTKLYFLWILIHYFSSKLYVYYCTPDTLIGFVRSSFMVITPECQAIDWVQRRSREIMSNMWMMIGMWCSTELMKIISPTRNTIDKIR